MTQTTCGSVTARSIGVIVLICVLVAAAPATAAERDSVLQQYIGAVLSGDWQAAETLWVPVEVAESRRLGIEFDGVPDKYDCASPLVLFRDAVRSGAAKVQVIDTASGTCPPSAVVAVSAGGTTVRATYELVDVGGDRRLASPVFACTHDWAIRETRFARVHFRDSSLVNDYALAELDRFVDSVLQFLQVPADRVRQLETAKIEYYLGDSTDVRLLTGFDTQGMTYLPLDAVVTQHLPHGHELVHVLVDFALVRVPLYTTLWMQEGLAVSLGGRWGKSPSVLMQLGAFVAESGMAGLTDVLTYRGFHEGTGAADVSYALSGLLVRHLLGELDTERALQLYRDLSGSDAQIQSFTFVEVERRIDALTGVSWDSTVHRCSVGLDRFRYSGLQPVDDVPREHPLFESEASGLVGRTWSVDSFYVCEVRADSVPVAGAFLFRAGDGDRLEGYRSRLFARQFHSRPYSGEILGIVFDEQEVGLYDYRTDNLLAKFASGFSSGETIWDAGERAMRFRLSKSASPVDLSGCTCLLVR